MFECYSGKGSDTCIGRGACDLTHLSRARLPPQSESKTIVMKTIVMKTY